MCTIRTGKCNLKYTTTSGLVLTGSENRVHLNTVAVVLPMPLPVFPLRPTTTLPDEPSTHETTVMYAQRAPSETTPDLVVHGLQTMLLNESLSLSTTSVTSLPCPVPEVPSGGGNRSNPEDDVLEFIITSFAKVRGYSRVDYFEAPEVLTFGFDFFPDHETSVYAMAVDAIDAIQTTIAVTTELKWDNVNYFIRAVQVNDIEAHSMLKFTWSVAKSQPAPMRPRDDLAVIGNTIERYIRKSLQYRGLKYAPSTRTRTLTESILFTATVDYIHEDAAVPHDILGFLATHVSSAVSHVYDEVTRLGRVSQEVTFELLSVVMDDTTVIVDIDMYALDAPVYGNINGV